MPQGPQADEYAYLIIVVIIKINLLSVPPNHIWWAKCITQTEALSEIKVSLLIQEICQHLATEAATLTFVMLSLKKSRLHTQLSTPGFTERKLCLSLHQLPYE